MNKQTVFMLIFSLLCFSLDVVYLQKKEGTISLKKKIMMFIFAIALLLATDIRLLFYFPENSWIVTGRLIFLINVLWLAAVTDYRKQIIPNMLIFSGIGFWMCSVFIELFFVRERFFSDFFRSLVASVTICIICFICLLIVKNSIGMGDIKLFFVMGLLQGTDGLFSSIFFSLLVSFFIACFLLLTKKKTRKDGIAFAPAIFLGTTISIMLGGM